MEERSTRHEVRSRRRRQSQSHTRKRRTISINHPSLNRSYRSIGERSSLFYEGDILSVPSPSSSLGLRLLPTAAAADLVVVWAFHFSARCPPAAHRPVAKNKAGRRRQRGRYQGETRYGPSPTEQREGGAGGADRDIGREGGGGAGAAVRQSGPSRRKLTVASIGNRKAKRTGSPGGPPLRSVLHKSHTTTPAHN